MAGHGLPLPDGRDFVISLVFGEDEKIAQWVSEKIGGCDFTPCCAIGIVKDGKPLAGVVYNNFIEHKGASVSLEMSVAAESREWLNKQILFALFAYPFIQIGVPRVQSTMAADNAHAIEFNKRLGFTQEGYGRKAYFDGRDCVVTSMLREECKWIRSPHGKIRA